jgi:hypothetical protein
MDGSSLLTSAQQLPWNSPVCVYDWDRRTASFVFTCVEERPVPCAWPQVLTLETSARIRRMDGLTHLPFVVLWYEGRVVARFSASGEMSGDNNNNSKFDSADGRKRRRRENNNHRESSSSSSLCYSCYEEKDGHPDGSALILVQFESPVVTYRMNAHTGRLMFAGGCGMMSRALSAPRRIKGGEDPELARMLHGRRCLIKKQLADQRVAIDLGNRIATYAAPSWRAVNLLLARGCGGDDNDSSNNGGEIR